MEKKKKNLRSNMPAIYLTDDETSLIEKFKHHFFATIRSDEYTSFYILGDRHLVDTGTIDYFVVTFKLESGRIVSVLSNETGLTLKYVIESGFDNIACNAPCIEGGMHINLHWPESDEDDQPEPDDEGVELHYVPGYEHDVAPIPVLKPVWMGQNLEPLKPVEDH